MSARDFLIEIGTEEIPAGYIEPAMRAFEDRLAKAFAEGRIAAAGMEPFATPRRLALRVSGLADRQEDASREVTGPPKRIAFDESGAPTKAAVGFAATNGVEVDALRTVETPKGEYLAVTVHEKGRSTVKVIGEIVPAIVASLPFPKTMRWEAGGFLFARPIRWIVALHGEEVVPVEIAGVRSGRVSRGHRILHDRPVEIAGPAEYETALEAAHVVPRTSRRRELIEEALAGAASGESGRILEDDALLHEVANLVETPHAIVGRFDDRFLELPDRIVITAMKSHQRYFSVVTDDGALLPRFVTVANGTAANEDDVRIGNERVLTARLADAEFYWNEDRSIPLADRVPLLDRLLWQEGLGSMLAKTERIEKIVAAFAGEYLGDERDVALRAARLSKADLTTEMIRDGKEFTALQGYMGMVYARAAGESDPVAHAILEQYLPRFSADSLPESGAGAILSLADRTDTLLGGVALDQMPSGSQDPYALRRHARAILRILADEKIPVALGELLGAGLAAYGDTIDDPGSVAGRATEFLRGRLRNLLTEKDYPYDVVDAVIAVGIDRPADVERRVAAIRDFRETDAFESLVAGCKRVVNILKKAESAGGEVDPGRFSEEAEKGLHAAVAGAREAYEQDLAGHDYRSAMEHLIGLRAPIDRFFEEVLVMDKDPSIRANRIALLAEVAQLFRELADLSKVVLEGEA